MADNKAPKEDKEGKVAIDIEYFELCRDDFIEWILRNTSEDSEFRVHKAKHYISVGIDKFPY